MKALFTGFLCQGKQATLFLFNQQVSTLYQAFSKAGSVNASNTVDAGRSVFIAGLPLSEWGTG